MAPASLLKTFLIESGRSAWRCYIGYQDQMTIIAVIPARGGSKRLPRKNIVPVFGRPMIEWAIEASLNSKEVESVFVSTEDKEIASIAQNAGVKVITRPLALAADDVPKMEVIRHADQWYTDQYQKQADVLLSIQANSPELMAADIDQAVRLLRDKSLWEVISLNQEGIQNAALRVIARECLYNTYLSANLGAIHNDYLDIHTTDDLDLLCLKYQDENEFLKRRMVSN